MYDKSIGTPWICVWDENTAFVLLHPTPPLLTSVCIYARISINSQEKFELHESSLFIKTCLRNDLFSFMIFMHACKMVFMFSHLTIAH